MLGLSPSHVLIFGVIAILLFGNRLPTVARSLGRSLTEFKKGMNDLQEEFKTSVYSDPASTSSTPPRVTYSSDQSEPAGPRFEPPKA
jgi:sec-independent protein translocase protein TatA